MERRRAGEHADAAGPRAVGPHRGHGGLFHGRVTKQAEVIVAGEHQHTAAARPACAFHRGTRPGTSGPQSTALAISDVVWCRWAVRNWRAILRAPYHSRRNFHDQIGGAVRSDSSAARRGLQQAWAYTPRSER